MRSKFTYVYSFFVAFVVTVVLAGFSGGRDGAFSGAPTESNCSSCHGGGGGTTTTSLAIAGNPTTFSRNTTYNLTLTVSNANTLIMGGGFQIVAYDGGGNIVGTFIPGAGTRLTSGTTNRLTHNAPKSMMGTGTVSWTFSWRSPSTATGNIRFYFAGNAVDLGGGSDGDLTALGSTPGSPLPVTMAKFDAKSYENSIVLDWQTASEENTAHYAVERSFDGINFTKIGRVEAVGNSSTLRKYRFVDETPLTATNYYRLRINDLDGKFNYSDILNVKNSKVKAVFYPNPAKSNENITLMGNYDPEMFVSLTALNGSVIVLRIKDNQISLPNLAAGIYYLNINGEKSPIVIL